MLRGGGVCVEGPAGSLPRVSPRIRALQDRLLDSLPADGAWECLSPAQREAIISLHRARLTRHFINQDDYREEAKRQARKANVKGISKGIHRYGRSRSYENKLESETDDSGVRLASGGTNSSTSNSQNSHEDDSSDPGVKRGGRFTKSPSASRLTRKEQKCSPDVNKPKNVTNGVGNVNKIISKQLNRTSQQCSSNVTLDCRNVSGDKRTRVDNNNGAIFESRQHQFEVKYRRFTTGDLMGKHEGISRKNILQRYQDSNPLIPKESTSSEEYDSGINFPVDKYEKSFHDSPKKRRPSSGVDYDFEFESDQTPRSDSTPSPCGPSTNQTRLNGENHRGMPGSMVTEGLWNRMGSKLKNESDVQFKKEETKRDEKTDYGAKMNSKFDYRNQLNQEGFINKYSSNWNSIILSRALPIRTHNIPPAKTNPLHSPLFKTSASPHGRSVGNLAYAERCCKSDKKFTDFSHCDTSTYPDKGQGKKYIRSKSLDRKYLDDTSDDDESDFEIRRRTDRMRRYAKANQEWEVHNKQLGEKTPNYLRQNPFVVSEVKPKSKSSWDIARKIDKDEGIGESSCFRSRSNIINRWKSEENELSKNIGHLEKKDFSRKDFDKYKWRRRSCDFELEGSDTEFRKKRSTTSPMIDDFNRKQWQRRSCDFELDFEDTESMKRNFYEGDWDDSVHNEMRILQKRSQFSPKTELRKMYPVPPPREKKENRKSYKEEIVHIDEPPSREKVLMDHAKKYQIRPEISGRKWARIEDEHHVAPFHHPTAIKMEKEKGKNPHAFRGKLRLFKSILPF